MYILPNTIKKKAKLLFIFNGWQALIPFLLVVTMFFLLSQFVNGYIRPFFIILGIVLGIILVLPSPINFNRTILDTLIFKIHRRKEFDVEYEESKFIKIKGKIEKIKRVRSTRKKAKKIEKRKF